MAMIQSWELSQYQYAAELMCQRLGDNPHTIVIDKDGQSVPQWVIYATRMHELRLMLDMMQKAGIPL